MNYGIKLSKSLLVAALCTGLLAVSQCPEVAQASPLRLGMTPEPYMPFTQVNAAGEWEGLEADLTNAICNKLPEGCKRKEMAWEGLMPSLTGNKVDFIVGAFSVTDKRRETVDFSISYYFEPTVLVGMKNDKLELVEKESPEGMFIDPQSLKNRIIGFQNASTQAAYAKAYFSELDTKSYTTADNAVADLTAGRIDLALIAKQYIEPFLASEAGKHYEVKKLLSQNIFLGEGLAYAVRKGDAQSLKQIDAILTELKEDGTVDTIIQKWFGQK